MNEDIFIPRCMSTQHPDNANLPFFAAGGPLSGEEEVREAYYAFNTLGCEEQMWDHEGKEVDMYVVPKLLAQYGSFFRKKHLGKKVFLTLRVPNPIRERASAKGLLEVLESIPRSFDVARQFYRKDLAPIFEVILPMTTNSLELTRVWSYYRDFVIGKAGRPVVSGDIPIKDWIGDFAPSTINVIPLIEDKESLLNADKIIESYMAGKELLSQRVFLARSDPALTYGSVAAVLMLKVALHRLGLLEKKMGLPIFPIVGLGSAPFRGNFKPTNALKVLKGYPSVQTFTVQSAFKFDYPEELVKNAILSIKRVKRKTAIPVENEDRVIRLIDKLAKTYGQQIEKITDLVNGMAQYVPSRRKRKLHVGLFGYQRSLRGKHLPRAIGFCAALYSLGLPPDLFGISSLTSSELKLMLDLYPNFKDDIHEVLKYFDPEALKLLPPTLADDIKRVIRLVDRHAEPDQIHQSLVRAIRRLYEKKESQNISELITQAGRERKFLG